MGVSRPGQESRGAWDGAAYNLFRCREGRDLVLAVPQDRAVPAFLTGEGWSFDRSVERDTDAPLGFNAGAAGQGTRLNGYYLFLACPGSAARA